jgi:hypothetical protein
LDFQHLVVERVLAGVAESIPLAVQVAVSPISKALQVPEQRARGLVVVRGVVGLRSHTSMREAVAVEPEVRALMPHLPIR